MFSKVGSRVQGDPTQGNSMLVSPVAPPEAYEPSADELASDPLPWFVASVDHTFRNFQAPETSPVLIETNSRTSGTPALKSSNISSFRSSL
jgi:hypothetical protein